MYPNKKKFDTRLPKKKFVISVEGGVTEKEYFDRIGKLVYETAIVDVAKDVNKSSPIGVLDRINGYRKSLSQGDELWCAIDMDRWHNHLTKFNDWIKCGTANNPRNLALTNPKFELWLLLHFIDWDGKSSIRKNLEKFIPNYDKHLDVSLITKETVEKAIQRAKEKTSDGKPPINKKGSNLWVLLERMMSSDNGQ